MNVKATRRQVPQNPIALMHCVYKHILPEVRSELDRIRQDAASIPDPELRKQALASIATKQFHCQGGAVYASARLDERNILIPLIVAFQTISDYLDNLCDRSTSMDPVDFRRMHQSMLDATDPDASLCDYYEFHAERDDGGYLLRLVQTCRRCIAMLPSYRHVMPYVRELVGLYVDLQVYKHIRHDLREPELLRWWETHRQKAPHLLWNEFAAATGSTLGVFFLFQAAADPHFDEAAARHYKDCYFPHVCGLHIMLDYLIDQEEDRVGGDLNFCNYYEKTDTLVDRIVYIVDRAIQDVAVLPAPRFHRMIIEGLLALYLSDPKVSSQRDVKTVSRRLMRNSPMTRLFFWSNSLWIRKYM